MRSKSATIAIALLAFVSCKGKPSLTDTDENYIRTTIALARLHATLLPTDDSIKIQARADSIYRRNATSKAAYLAEAEAIGSDPGRAEVVYAAIKDSLGIK